MIIYLRDILTRFKRFLNPHSRHGAVHQRGSAGGGVAGGTHRPRVLAPHPGQSQAARIRRVAGLHLRAGDRGVRARQDAGQARQLHLPVPAGHQEADEEVRAARAPGRLHLTEPLPEVLL